MLRSISGTVFVVLILLCIVQVFYYYPLLPEQVASHFGASGRPDAWSSKDSFVRIYLIVVAVIAFLFSILGFVLRKAPISLISLPNKDYWLAPERRQHTINDLTRQFLWFGSATLVLLLDVFHQTFQVQIGRVQAMTHPLASLVVYIVVTLIWSIALVARFMRRP